MRPEATHALAVLRQTHAVFTEAAMRRNETIGEASQAGCTLRQIAETLDGELSLEAIRTIAGPKMGVAFEWQGEGFQVSEPQTRALIYKADGFGRGDFRGDVAMLGAGEAWPPKAADLATAMRRVHVGRSHEPIALDEEHAFALFQMLRGTYMTLSRLSELRERLAAHFGIPAPIPRHRISKGRR